MNDTEILMTKPRPHAPEREILVSHLGLLVGAQTIIVAGTALTLTDAHNGYILDFRSSSPVTVTVPAGLRDGFNVGISQGGAGQVTLSPSGVTINEVDGNLATAAQYVMLQLIAFQPDDFRLFGRTA